MNCPGPLLFELSDRTPIYQGERGYDELPFCSENGERVVAKRPPAEPKKALLSGPIKRANDTGAENETPAIKAEKARLRLPAIVHGQAPCPCKPIGTDRSHHIRSDRFMETVDPKLPRATIHSIGKHIFPPRERPCWISETRSSYPPRFTRPPPIAPRPPLGKVMHEDRRWLDYLSEPRKEYGVKEADTAPVKYVDQARHTFKFQEDLRNDNFESNYGISYPPRFDPPPRPSSRMKRTHVTFGDRRNEEFLSEAQKSYIQHPLGETLPFVKDQSRHTYNFKPEPRLCDPQHTSYGEAYAPRPDFRPEVVDGSDFYRTHFKMGDEQKENEWLSMYLKEYREHPPATSEAQGKDLHRTNFKLFGSKDNWESTYGLSYANRPGARPKAFSADSYKPGVKFTLRDPKSRAEQSTTTNMADFVDHGMGKPPQENGDQGRTTMVMTDPRLKEIADYHKKTTYGEYYYPKFKDQRRKPFIPDGSCIDDCMGRDKKTSDYNSTYRTDMQDFGVTPPEERMNPDYVWNFLSPGNSVVSRGRHVKMSGNTGEYETEHRDRFNPKTPTAISPELRRELGTRQRVSHFCTYNKFKEYLSEYQDRYIEMANIPEKPNECLCKCDCKCKCLTPCECSGALEPVNPFRGESTDCPLTC